MKKIAISIFSMLTLGTFLSFVTKSAGPPGCHAGEPPTFLDCTSCHSEATVNSGLAQVSLDVGGAENGYVPGETYHITVSVKKTGMLAAGFQFVALQDNDLTVSPGEIILTNPISTQKVDASNPHVQGCNLLDKVWVEHTFKGILSDTTGESHWSFDWKAPDLDLGHITFYLAALESNYNGEESGDFVYTRTASANPILSSISKPEPALDVQVFPNPATSELYVRSDDFIIEKIKLIDINGRCVRQFDGEVPSPGSGQLLYLKGMNAGVYLVLIQSKESYVVKRIIFNAKN